MTDLLSRRATARTEARKGGNVGTSPAPAPVNKYAQIQEDARKRTAAAWTTSKNLLPGSPIADQQKLASALITAPTGILADTLRAVARMAFYTKAAEKFEEGTKKELNVLIEDEGMMKKLRNEVFAENKGEAKNATRKQAEEPPVAEDEKKPKDPAAPAPADPGAEAPLPEGGDPAAAPPEFQEPAAGAPAAPGEMGDPGMGEDPASPVNQVGDSATDESLMDRIDQVESEIEGIKQKVTEAGDDAFNLDSFFNPEVQADNAQNLANEGENMDQTNPEDFFSPGDTGKMTDSTDFGGGGHKDNTDADFFKDASGPDSMAMLFGDHKTAADVDVEMGDMRGHFETDLAGDDRDSETDHEDTLLGDVLDAIKPEVMKQKRDTEPKLETAPGVDSKSASAVAAAAKKSSVRTVGNPVPAAKTAGNEFSDESISGAIFGDNF